MGKSPKKREDRSCAQFSLDLKQSKPETQQAAKKLHRVCRFITPGRNPHNLQHSSYRPDTEQDVGHRVRLLSLDIGSFLAGKTALGNYIHDHGVKLVVLTETDLSHAKIALAALLQFTCTEHSCRIHKNIEGG